MDVCCIVVAVTEEQNSVGARDSRHRAPSHAVVDTSAQCHVIGKHTFFVTVFSSDDNTVTARNNRIKNVLERCERDHLKV